MECMGLFDTIFSARAQRRFRSDPVPNELISRILDAAVQAPSGGNTQTWLFVVIKDEEQRRKVAAIYAKASKVIRYFYSKRERPAHMNEKQYERFWASGVYLHKHMGEAPVLLLACLKLAASGLPPELPPDCEEIKPESVLAQAERTRCGSIYPAVQNIILACRALGLGTVLTTNHVLYEDNIRSVLGLPANVQTYALMPIGFPGDNFGPVRRKPLSEVAVLDRWDNPWIA